MAMENSDLEQKLRSMIISNPPAPSTQAPVRTPRQSLGAQRSISGERVPQQQNRNGFPDRRQQHPPGHAQDQNIVRSQNNRPSPPSAQQNNRNGPIQTQRPFSNQAHRGNQQQQQVLPNTNQRYSQSRPPAPSQQQPPHNGGPRQNNAFRSAPSKFTPLMRPSHSHMDQMAAQDQFLEQLAAQWLPQLEMSAEEFKSKDFFRVHLDQALKQAVLEAYADDPLQISLASFGSFSSGFAMPSSDMDLALLVSRMTAELPRLLEKHLLNMGLGARLLSRTRVPIIKVCERPTADLYAALREEREKWDAMTPEERERYDRTGNKDEDVVKEETEEGAKENGESAESHDIEHTGAELDSDKTAQSSSDGKRKPRRRNQNPKGNNPGDSQSQQHFTDDLEATSLNTRQQPIDATTANSPTSPTSTTTENTSTTTDGPKQRRPPRPWYREKRLSPLDFPKTGTGIQCDINFSNPLGLHNTLLLRCYSHCDTRVRLMVLFVKAWASRRKINSGYNGTLSSYGYVLMVLHYLVNVANPPVCPNLQLAKRGDGASWNPSPNSTGNGTPADPNSVCEGWDVRFWRNEQEILQLAAKGMLTHNQQPLGVLLREFFQYYAQQGYNVPRGGFVWTGQVLSLRTPGGILSKEAKGWTGAKTTMMDQREIRHRFLFAIEDPFELSHNVARTVTHNGIVAIRDEFRRARRILVQVGQGQPPEGDLLALVEDMAPPAGSMEENREKEKKEGEQAGHGMEERRVAVEAA